MRAAVHADTSTPALDPKFTGEPPAARLSSAQNEFHMLLATSTIGLRIDSDWVCMQMSAGQKLTGRSCATALSVCERQGLVWVCPTPGAAPSQDAIPGL